MGKRNIEHLDTCGALAVLHSLSFTSLTTAEGECLDVFRVPSARGCVEFIRMPGASDFRAHVHAKSHTWIYVLSGSGHVMLGVERKPYAPGDFFDVPADLSHGFSCQQPTLILTMQDPPVRDLERGEIDIYFP